MIRIYFDGAASNNQSENRIAGIGVVVEKENESGIYEKVYEFYKNIGNKTNNEAEWLALIKALKLVKKTQHKYKKFEILGDSNLVVNQFNGDWKIKDEKLKNLYLIAKNLSDDINAEIEVKWIKREKNKADKLAKKAAK